MVRVFAHGAMGRQIDPPWGGPIKLFLDPASAPRLVLQRLWYVLFCLWDDAYKKNLVAYVAAAGFLSLSEWSFTICPTPYNRK